MNLYYIMKIAVILKETQAILDTELVCLSEIVGDFSSHLSLLDKAEELKNGFSTGNGKYEVKAIPVAVYKSQDKLVLFDPESKNGVWYLNHAKDPDSAVVELLKKISA